MKQDLLALEQQINAVRSPGCDGSHRAMRTKKGCRVQFIHLHALYRFTTGFSGLPGSAGPVYLPANQNVNAKDDGLSPVVLRGAGTVRITCTLPL
jgi:hypothetical protein